MSKIRYVTVHDDGCRTYRAWFMVAFNPILRRIGYSIIAVERYGIVRKFKIRPYPEHCQLTDDDGEPIPMTTLRSMARSLFK